MLKIAFKKSFYNWHFDGIYGLFITLRNFLSGQFNCIAHVEIIFDNIFDIVSFACVDDDIDDNGMHVSGARFKHIKYSHLERWLFLDWNVNDKRLPKLYKDDREIYDLCKSMLGTKYDWLGILGQAIGIPEIEDSKELYCSEAVGYIIGYTDYPSPSRLYMELKRDLGTQEFKRHLPKTGDKPLYQLSSQKSALLP